MLDQAASKIGDAVSGGDKGKRTLALTSLTTDKLISQLGSLIPILLLLFIKTFNSELFSKESLACEPRAYLNFTTTSGSYRHAEIVKSKNNNRFYFNEYCWNNMRDIRYEYDKVVEII